MAYPNISIFYPDRKKKCAKCGDKPYVLINNEPFCLKHYVKDYYGNHRGCMEAFLDMLCGDLMRGGKINPSQVKLLKEIKKQFPEIAKEFPRIFKNIK